MTEPLCVLLADDDRVPRTLLRRMLEAWGLQVTEVEDGLAAWEVLQSESTPRIAILDWMMPGLDGVALCRKLRALNHAPLVYTILLTSKRQEEDLVHALDNGAHDFQSKPVRPGELKARIAVGRRLVETHDRLQASLREMERLASTDVLTGIANRRAFFDLARQELQRTQRYGHAVTGMLLDIDQFKRINDEFGHQAGDAALIHVARICEQEVRESDILARYGGDELAALLLDADEETALEIAERLRQAVADTPFEFAGSPRHLTVSIGLATTASTVNIDQFLNMADQALFLAKDAGRNRVRAWERRP
ncbi:MAG: diguanylate cyclase [Ectothiorhodospiraceae bacterium]